MNSPHASQIGTTQRKVNSTYRPKLNLLDRLATVTLSQALKTPTVKISSDIDELDDALGGGFSCGQITEIYGPPGSGKTSLALQAAARVVQEGHQVVWIECSQRLPASRLRQMLESPTLDEAAELKLMHSIHCLVAQSMASLCALFAQDALPKQSIDSTNTSQFPVDTKLIVIDDLTTLHSVAFPPDIRDFSNRSTATNSKIETPSLKRAKVLAFLSSNLNSIAASGHVAVLILNKMATKVEAGGAALVNPYGDSWSHACANRLLIYRDAFNRKSEQPYPERVALRWIAVQKLGNKNLLTPEGIPVVIDDEGLKLCNSVEPRNSQLRKRPDIGSGEFARTKRLKSGSDVQSEEESELLTPPNDPDLLPVNGTAHI